MSINFCHPRIKPTIECETLASEGYEITNLISEDYESSQKGFLAERFVSCPVILTIKFICPITISSIIIWPKVGSQKSTGFELSSLKASSCNETTTEEYRRFASGYSRNDVDVIVFHKEGCNDNPTRFGTSFTQSFFRGRNHENIVALRVKIFRSHYIPALKKLEIWGEPGYLCDWKTKKHIRRTWFQINQHSSQSEASCSTEKPITVTDFIPNLEHVQVPEEFYDEITHEVMTLPVMLPSGKKIDQRTLEKCQKEEERWGRLPSDPFTGLIFTTTSKPIVDTILKSKIDEFLLKYSHLEQIKYLPRRLGSESNLTSRAKYAISKIIDNPAEKRKLDLDGTSSKKIKTEGITVQESHSPANDLNKMLAKTLSNLPSFLNVPKAKSESILCCVVCSVLEQLYRLPCSHILCRSCTVEKQNYCNNCDKRFTFAEIQKIHPNRNINSVSG